MLFQVVRTALVQNAEALRYASQELRASKEFVATAMRIGSPQGSALRFAATDLRADFDFLMALGAECRSLTVDYGAVMPTPATHSIWTVLKAGETVFQCSLSYW